MGLSVISGGDFEGFSITVRLKSLFLNKTRGRAEKRLRSVKVWLPKDKNWWTLTGQ